MFLVTMAHRTIILTIECWVVDTTTVRAGFINDWRTAGRAVICFISIILRLAIRAGVHLLSPGNFCAIFAYGCQFHAPVETFRIAYIYTFAALPLKSITGQKRQVKIITPPIITL